MSAIGRKRETRGYRWDYPYNFATERVPSHIFRAHIFYCLTNYIIDYEEYYDFAFAVCPPLLWIPG